MVINKIQCPFSWMRQMAVAGLIAAIGAFYSLAVLRNGQLAQSLVCGILLWLLPGCYFASKLFYSGVAKIYSTSFLKRFYKAEIIKLFLSGVGFLVAIKLLSINVPALIAGYFFSQLVFLARVIMQKKWTRKVI